MLNGKTKQVVAAAVISATLLGQGVYITDVQSQMKRKSEDLTKLNNSLTNLNERIDKLKKDNDDMTSYIKSQEEKYKLIDDTTKKMQLVQAENDELKRKNDLISHYQLNNYSPNRGKLTQNSGHISLKKIMVEVSMYSREECGNNKTNSGKRPEWGMIAAPAEIPMGTKMIMPNDSVLKSKVFTVEDRGGYIQKVGDTYRIDVFVETTKYADNYGRKYNTEAYIVEYN